MKAVALLVVASLTACSAIADTSVAGLWSANERTKGGLGTQWSFTGDGHVTKSFGAIVEFTYRIDGSKLITTFSKPGEPPEKTTDEFALSADMLTLNPRNAEAKQVMKRMGRPISGVSPIVGAWSYQHYTGAQAVDRYSSKGAMLLSVPMQSIEGTYKLVGSRMTISLQGQPPSDFSVEVSGTQMTMIDHGTKHAFTRFDF